MKDLSNRTGSENLRLLKKDKDVQIFDLLLIRYWIKIIWLFFIFYKSMFVAKRS
tara:strand:- start:421 stop:582 length:162 start_codon:yes stop_codon:yes gene_type:complete